MNPKISFVNCKNWKVSWIRKTADYCEGDYPNSTIIEADNSGESIKAAQKQHNLEEGKYFFRTWPAAEKAPTPKGQIELPLKHFPFQEYLGNFKHIRKALAKANSMLTSWKQLPLKLHLRKLYKIPKVGFIWTRPDGKQFACKTMRKLVARIMDYDGHLLGGVLRMI